jgi:hypothetical protein
VYVLMFIQITPPTEYLIAYVTVILLLYIVYEPMPLQIKLPAE